MTALRTLTNKTHRTFVTEYLTEYPTKVTPYGSVCVTVATVVMKKRTLCAVVAWLIISLVLRLTRPHSSLSPLLLLIP